MHLSDSVLIRATVEDVWAAVDDERLLHEWNPKVVEVSHPSPGRRRVGYAYQVVFEMSGRRTRMRALVVERHPPNRLVVRLEPAERRGLAPTVTEQYTLESVGDGHVRLEQTIDLSSDGIPRWARVLMWVIQRFGKPVDKPYLARLKELIEARR